MTERTAGGRALNVLKAIGMEDTPVGVLEREDALFVLTPQTLVYQDGGGIRRVTLRDLTRIHSDDQGLLRVETPAGTALTATLLGYDVAQVQAFFVQVRDTTARAKDHAVSPVPTPGGLKAFGAAPAAADAGPPERTTPPKAAVPPPAPPTPTPPAPTPVARPVAATPAQAPASTPVAAPPPVAGPAAAGSSAAAQSTTRPADRPGDAPPPPAATPAPPAARPVVISSSAFTPGAARTPTAVQTAPPAPERRPPPAAPSAPAPAPAVPDARPPAEPVVAAPVPARAAVPAPDAVARHADAVEALTGRLRFLGGVLFVGALALAAVQFTSGARLDGLWTLLSGGVGSIALLALADMARLLVLSVRAAPRPSGSDDA